MRRKVSRIQAGFIALLVAGITILHYITELPKHSYHLFYQGLYFLPVILGGFWFGLRGGLLVSITITLLYIPFTVLTWNGPFASDFNNVMEMVLYIAIAVVLGLLRDRQRDQQRRLRDSERLVAMGTAYSALAHDIRTPLVAVGGLIRSIRKDLKGDGKSLEKLDTVVKETARLENMVTEILDFSRPLRLHRSEASMRRILSDCVAMVSDHAQQRGITIQLGSSEDLPPVIVDPARMKQVFINLLTNAIEASPAGETVKLHPYRKGRKILVDITDHGEGIPPEKREQIFMPFFTTKRGGTGLGLPVAKKIAEAHRGALQVLDPADGGVTFRVSIPIG